MADWHAFALLAQEPPRTTYFPSGDQSMMIANQLAPELSLPAEPAVRLDLVRVPGTQVEMARYETTSALWKQVRDWAVARDLETDYDGDMGSMDYWGFDLYRVMKRKQDTLNFPCYHISDLNHRPLATTSR